MLEEMAGAGVSAAMKAVLTLALSVCLLTSLAASARAEDAREALHQRLDSFDEAERKLLAPYLERGPVGLIEFARGGDLPAVIVASYVNAPADKVARLIARPAEYPKFMQTIDSVEVLSQFGPQTSYKWTWRTGGVLFLEGENRMTAYGPPPGHPEQGHRIAINSERGHLGEGRLMWRVFPVSEARSIMVLAMRIDMRDANFVMKQLDAAARSLNRSVNLALCFVMLLNTKVEAEKQNKTPQILPKSVPLERPALDLAAFKPLLGRGDLLFAELTEHGFGKLAIAGRTGLRREDLWPVMTEPETFGKSLVPGSYTRVQERGEKKKRFTWGIDLPLIGTEGEMVLEEKPGDLVFIDATNGAMKGGKWRFATPTLPDGEVVVVGWSLFDISRAAWLIQKLAEVDPMMGHGLSAATQVMLLRALRSRAKQEKAERNGVAAPGKNRDAPPAKLPAKIEAAPASASVPATTAVTPNVATPAAPAVAPASNGVTRLPATSAAPAPAPVTPVTSMPPPTGQKTTAAPAAPSKPVPSKPATKP
jgi:hypothetical protein